MAKLFFFCFPNMLKVSRKVLFCCLVAVLLPSSLWGQSMARLWDRFDAAQNDNMPLSAIEVLSSLESVALDKKAYGELLLARLRHVDLLASAMPEKLSAFSQLLADAADGSRQGDPSNETVSDKVAFATLGYIHSRYASMLPISDDEARRQATHYFGLALDNPALLANVKAAVAHSTPHDDISLDAFFSYDLLHVIALLAADFDPITSYYTSHDNATAALMASLLRLENEKSQYIPNNIPQYIACLDSLLYIYHDLPAAAEVAIERFAAMDISPDISAEEKISFIDEALLRWGSQPRMAILRNARSLLTLPSFSLVLQRTLFYPDEYVPIYISAIRNATSLTMNIYQLDISGDESFSLDDASSVKELLTHRSPEKLYTEKKTYYGMPDYREVRDTITLPKFPEGVYLAEFTADGTGSTPKRAIFHVSNLRLIDMSLPHDFMRLAVVDATSGKPIPNATIDIKFREWNANRLQESQQKLTTESDGEVVYSSVLNPYSYRISTPDDKAFPYERISRRRFSTASASHVAAKLSIRLFTSQALYRPGDTISMALVAYNEFSSEKWQVASAEKISVALVDRKGNKVAEQEVTTDSFGTAHATFQAPRSADVGYYTIVATSHEARGSVPIRVEEYVPPTFSISIDEPKVGYKAGDTLSLTAWAKTLYGVAFGGAKVKTEVTTRLSSWWRSDQNASSTTLLTEESLTAADGSVVVRVPMEFPQNTTKGSRLARVSLTLTITSASGETHSITRDFSLSDRPTTFDLDGFSDKFSREENKPFSFVYVNNQGIALNDTVTYTIDNMHKGGIATSSPLTLPLDALTSGAHTLRAVCNADTLEREFVVFSLNDSAVPIDTPAWYYSTQSTTADNLPSLTILVGTSLEEQTIFYAVASADSLFESGQIVLSDEMQKREFVYKKEYGDGVAIRYSWVRNGELYSYSESLSRPLKDCSLDVKIASKRDFITLGGKEEISLTVKRPDGTIPKAQVLAGMRDKALDTIFNYEWSLVHKPFVPTPKIYQTAGYDPAQQYIYAEATLQKLREPQLVSPFATFESKAVRQSEVMPLGSQMRLSRTALTTDEAGHLSTKVAQSQPTLGALANATPDVPANIEWRDDFTATAFFLPQLLPDANGNLTIKFTTPQSLTTWRFMAIAHDKEMNVGSASCEMIARKELMISPNLPRFLREGDEAEISATISNLSTSRIAADASIILSDTLNNVVFKATQSCRVESNSTQTITFNLPQTLKANTYLCDISVATKGASDGERHFLQVLSDNVDVVATRAFTPKKAGAYKVDLTPLYGKNATNESLKVEYTPNPAWLLLDALPTVEKPTSDNAISLATALFTLRLSEIIQSHLPESLSPQHNASSALEIEKKLQALQNADGSFSWFARMHPSTYVSLAVAKLLARGKHLKLSIDESMLVRVMTYLDNEAEKNVDNAFAIDYLYIQALASLPLSNQAKTNAKKLLKNISPSSPDLSIYQMALLAVIYSIHSEAKDMKQAEKMLERLRQYSVETEEMGRYFDTPKAKYSWQDYKIPTQTAVIEAFEMIAPNEQETISTLEQWLLQEKRTTLWSTPLTSVEAVYAFFNGWSNFSPNTLENVTNSAQKPSARLFVDGKEIDNNVSTEGSGYFSKTFSGRHKEFVAVASSDNIAWGAVSVTFSQPLDDVSSSSEGFTLQREIIPADGNAPSSTPKVGDKVKVRITINAQRDFDFVEITDNRPACLEPVEQLSGYYDGGYVTPLDDKTVYYFDKFAKGKHVVETEYFIYRSGDYRAGPATVRCAYAPEYQAREGQQKLEVTP